MKCRFCELNASCVSNSACSACGSRVGVCDARMSIAISPSLRVPIVGGGCANSLSSRVSLRCAILACQVPPSAATWWEEAGMVENNLKHGATFMCCGQGARPVSPATLRSEGSATPAWSRRDLCQLRAFSPENTPSLIGRSTHRKHTCASEAKVYRAANKHSKRDIRCYFRD